MKIFHCDHCGHLLFFENTRCLSCGRDVAYLPDVGEIGSLDPADDGRWRSPLRAAASSYRLCRNYTDEEVCNWAVPDGENSPLCRSCRLTRVIPDLGDVNHRKAWYRLEAAKRRLLATLLALGLPVQGRQEDPAHGFAFEFKADPADPSAPRVLTGHAQGVITVNLAEADDAERERRRTRMHEPYRTLLGHMRHESGHYYWDYLVQNRSPLDGFRRLFGDDRADYAAALTAYHERGAPPDWSDGYVSAYATAHAWEDWAETWAHYLHMVDTLETAAACGVSLRPRRSDEPALPGVPEVFSMSQPFDRLYESWVPLTYVLNNLNRGLGMPDGYPFALPPPAIEKLRFVHDVVETSRTAATISGGTGLPAPLLGRT
jgi:hypothetical protein